MRSELSGATRRRMNIVLGIASMCVSTMLAAQAPNQSRPSYAADGFIQVNDTAIPFKTFHDQGKDRREQTIEGNQNIMILRPDLGIMYMVLPDANMAMQVPVGKEDMLRAGQLFLRDEGAEPAGRETVGGEVAIKYTLPSGADGMQTSVWVTDDGIPVKMEGFAGGQRVLYMELSEIRRGPQDAGLFEVPDGVQLMQMPAGMPMPGLPGGMPPIP